ncbi:hypothetical protein ACIPR8_06375 [Stenotrophomonas sp. LARHCG68]
MTQVDEALLKAIGVWGNIDSRLGGLALSYLATLEKINEVASIQFADDALDRYSNKMRMKDVGGAAIQYNDFLHETAILSLAKVIDDTARDLKQTFNFKFDSFDKNHDVSNVKILQQIRCLANVIKHNGSDLVRGSSTSATFLIDECGMADGWDLGTLILTRDPAFNIIEHVPTVYFSMLELVAKASGRSHPALAFGSADFFNWVYSALIPDVIPLDRPQRQAE